ncbi:MAG TPA: hypothetical protein VG838_05545 [Opitutaceae bacterium]|nr:hypothetical protein [Opitutaceae bacterium]
MPERFLQHVRVERPDPAETAAEARVRLAAKFPRTALRRMTHLGLLAGAALDGLALQPEDAVVYATTYAETRALEDYLLSFPTPSPLLFQTSIHPSAVQQVLIGRQQPIRRFWPMTGRVRLVEAALLAALLEPAPRVVFAGGEERGTWLLEQAMASDRAFAFAALLTTDPAGAAGAVRFQPDPDMTDNPAPALDDFAAALTERRPLRWRGAGGEWTITWS